MVALKLIHCVKPTKQKVTKQGAKQLSVDDKLALIYNSLEKTMDLSPSDVRFIRTEQDRIDKLPEEVDDVYSVLYPSKYLTDSESANA